MNARTHQPGNIATWQMWAPRCLRRETAHLQRSKSPRPSPNLPSAAPITSTASRKRGSRMKTVITAQPAPTE